MDARVNDLIEISATLTPEQLTQVASNTSLKLDILSTGGALSPVRHIGVRGEWTMDATELNAHVRAWGGLSSDHVAILAVRKPSSATICLAPMQESTILIMPAGTEINASIVPGTSYLTVLVPTAKWYEIMALAIGSADFRELAAPVAFTLDLRRSIQAAGILRSLPQSIARNTLAFGSAMPAAVTDYLGLVAEALHELEAGEPRHNESLFHRVYQAWSAVDYIVEHLSEDISIIALCRHVKASRRQLEYAFHCVFGVGPQRFIMLTRLNESRRRLAEAHHEGRSVTEVAMELGITHLGRYSENYRRLFGERPSETLGRGHIS